MNFIWSLAACFKSLGDELKATVFENMLASDEQLVRVAATGVVGKQDCVARG